MYNKNVSENDDNDDDYKFFWNKKTEEIKVSKFGGWGRNKGFWPEYLPMHVHSSVYAILVQAICSHKCFKFFSVYSSYANIEMSRKLSLK